MDVASPKASKPTPEPVKAAAKPSRTSRIVGALAAYRHLFGVLAALAILGIAAYALVKLTREVRYAEVVAAFDATSWTAIALALVFTFVSFLGLIVYDFGALSYVGRRLRISSVAPTALCAYAVGNTAGFGPLSGGAIRYRGYSRMGLGPEEVAKVIAFVTVAFGLGLLVVGAVGILVDAETVAPLLSASPTALRLAALVGLVPLALLFALGSKTVRLGRFGVRLPGRSTVLRQLAATLVDITASAAVLYVLLPSGTIDFLTFFCVYAVAIGLGVLSHVPAGLGVFETVMIATLGGMVEVDQILGALVLYRVIYYLVPLICAALFVSLTEIRSVVQSRVGLDFKAAGGRLAPAVLSAFSFVLGTMLILSSVTPTPAHRLDVISDYVPLAFVEGAHFLASLLGLAMVVMARGLAQRLDGAFLGTLGATLVAVVLTLVQAAAFTEASLLGLLALMLLASRKEFKRPASIFRQALTGPWLLAIATICIGAGAVLLFVYRDVAYAHDLWWQFEFESEAPRSLRALLGVVIFSSAVAVWSLVRPAIGHAEPPTPEELERATAIVAAQDEADGNLVRMGDKSLLFSEDGRAFVMYGRKNRSMIALFDPIGPREAWPELVWRFIEMARGAGCRAVFYQVSPDALSLYADAGMQAFRLGEMATVDLARFDLVGGKRAGLRQAKARGARDGLSFEVVAQPGVAAVLPELTAVSDAWLARHEANEKAFSLGAFEAGYMLSQPVAILKQEGRIVAFANLLLTDTKAEGSIDLMRFHPDAPAGAMDVLFVHLLEHLKAEGYGRFNMGMAPLSGMSGRKVAPIWDRVGTTVFEHGERFYNFKGLRAFKAKFHPGWRARYMTTAGGLSPALALVDVTLLIGGGLKGVAQR
ncbi:MULTISPECIES: bifunctional lysylphosphatidylglycerol flippase/synthetase MprF [unclassified Aureimonas]|uniref:bifunctional lysylphosphatidylglycerol flippase/synthetase MprF n=1 Tax=unclassified Aureimonas TaxID=2615206 RepID=UPI0006F58845|nr:MULTISPECIES: bifunctional lysylphosphatidylglycerol flippase/synthetase MprF [unclassified Aureimonas]KQT69617.1 hypothetical protein ASG62_00285 [Aureimonas sp. Leaf427]KQT80968.1 hypothetical protein ASG54_05815 [Aureimonas sp. Leaf460]